MLLTILILISLFIIPVAVLYFRIISSRYKLYVLSVVVILVIPWLLFKNYSFFDLGFRIDNFSSSLIPYFIFTIVGLFVIFIFAKFQKKKFRSLKDPHFYGLFIFVSFIQEFLYRGFLMKELSVLISFPILIIAINTILFVCLHFIYKLEKIGLIILILAGIGFSMIYFFYPNLILITISHSLLNFYVCSLGYYSEDRT